MECEVVPKINHNGDMTKQDLWIRIWDNLSSGCLRNCYTGSATIIQSESVFLSSRVVSYLVDDYDENLPECIYISLCGVRKTWIRLW